MMLKLIHLHVLSTATLLTLSQDIGVYVPLIKSTQICNENDDCPLEINSTISTKLAKIRPSIDVLQASVDAIVSANITNLKNYGGCVCDCPDQKCSNSIVKTFSSCKAILELDPLATSNYYWIHDGSTDSPVWAFCDMDGANCGGTGGWTRIANLNMDLSGSRCPGEFTELTLSNTKVCGRFDGTDQGCGSAFFSSPAPYTEVCGRVRGYQHGSTDAFGEPGQSIDDYRFVDGISITYGSPRVHVWAYAGGLRDTGTSHSDCPCNTGNTNTPPDFVEDHYYCESATSSWSHGVFYASDPLWDGEQCNNKEGPCCTAPNMPWFMRVFDSPITDDIELRVCTSDGNPLNEDTPFDQLELYVR